MTADAVTATWLGSSPYWLSARFAFGMLDLRRSAVWYSNILSRRRDDREKWGDRLPPGQKVVEDWPVLTYGGTPRVDLNGWRFRVFGLGRRRGRVLVGRVHSVAHH